MANYISHNTKKLQLFRKKEEHLRRLISRGAEQQKCLQAAEEVRLAKILALLVQYANPPGFHGSDAAIQLSEWRSNLLAKVEALQRTTTEAFLAEFK